MDQSITETIGKKGKHLILGRRSVLAKLSPTFFDFPYLFFFTSILTKNNTGKMLKNIVFTIELVQLIYNTIFDINKKEFRYIESTELIKKNR